MNMGLVDTETINGTFTWNNKASQVASKLDRFIISEDLLLIRLLKLLPNLIDLLFQRTSFS